MITSRRAKRLIAEICVVIGALAALGAILLATKVISLTSTTADPAGAFHRVAELPPEADALVQWDTDTWTQDRALEPATRVALEAAYVRAWAAIGVYQSSGATTALTALFTGAAKSDALAVPRDVAVATWSIGHRLRLEFYALDGATVALTDTAARLVRTVGAGQSEAVVDATESYSVVMVLQDGYWRISQLRRAPDATLAVVTGTGSTGTVVTGVPTEPPRPVPAFTGSDYTPVGWPDTAAATITTDLDRARNLGLSAVRVRIPFATLTSEASLARLPELLSSAEAAGMRVVLVLFDGLADLSPASWGAADHDLAAVVAATAGGPALSLWDLADGPDRRTAAATPTEISAFVVHESRLLRDLSPTVPLTVSWSQPDAATDPALVGLVDAVSLSWTGSAADLPEAIGRVQSVAGGRPVMLAAQTTPTNGGWSPFPHSERRQAVEVAAVLTAAGQAGVTSTVVNQLQDTTTDRTGLLRVDGTGKPAAALVHPGAPLSTVSGPGIGDYLAANFWRATIVVVLAGILFAVRRPGRDALRRWRNRLRRSSGQSSRK